MSLRTWRTLKLLAERKRDEEQRRLGFLDRRIDASKEMMVRIVGYQDDVSASHRERVLARPLAPQVVTGAVDVYMRLDEAKERQQQDIDNLIAMRAKALADLQRADAEVSKFDKLIERAVAEQRAAQDRLEQKASDEITNAKMARALLNLRRIETRA